MTITEPEAIGEQSAKNLTTEQFRDLALRMETEIGKVIVGQRTFDSPGARLSPCWRQCSTGRCAGSR